MQQQWPRGQFPITGDTGKMMCEFSHNLFCTDVTSGRLNNK
jgi:hypothetical protein